MKTLIINEEEGNNHSYHSKQEGYLYHFSKNISFLFTDNAEHFLYLGLRLLPLVVYLGEM